MPGENTLARAYVQILPSAEGLKENLKQLFDGSMPDGGDIGKQLGADIGEAVSKSVTPKGDEGGRSFGEKFGEAAKSAAKVGLEALSVAAAAVGTTAVAALKGLVEGTGEVAAYGDQIDKMSQKMGLSTDAYQEWDFVMQHNGTTIEGLQASMKTLANAAESESDAFEALGISQEEVAGMSQEDLFAATITALQDVTDETERTYLAGQLLGRGATELGPLLNMTAEDTAALRQQAHELGGVMSEDAVKAAAAYQDSLQNLETGLNGLKNGALAEFLPAVTGIMDGVTAVVTGDEGGLELITQGISEFAGKILEMIPEFAEIGGGIITALGEAVIDNLPMIVESGTEVAVLLLTTLLDHLPEIAKVGLTAIVTLATGIGQSLPELIPAIVEVVLEIVKLLTAPDTMLQLIGAALQIMIGIAGGLIQAIPQLVLAIPDIIISMVDGFLSYDWGGLGDSIIEGIKKGVVDSAKKAVEAIKETAKRLLDAAKDVLGIHSPSRAFEDIVGRQIPAGIAEGIEDSSGDVTDAVRKMSQDAIGAFDGDFAVNASIRPTGTGGAGSRTVYCGGITINVVARDGESADDIVKRIKRELVDEIESGEAVAA